MYVALFGEARKMESRHIGNSQPGVGGYQDEVFEVFTPPTIAVGRHRARRGLHPFFALPHNCLLGVLGRARIQHPIQFRVGEGRFLAVVVCSPGGSIAALFEASHVTGDPLILQAELQERFHVAQVLVGRPR